MNSKKFDEIILRLKQKGHDKVIAPTLGRKEKLEDRVRHKLMKIRSKRKLLHHNKAVSLGLIKVQ